MKNLPFRILLIVFALAGTGAAVAAERIPASTALASVVTRVTPEIPALAKQLKLSGVVEMDVTIDEEGAVESVSVLRGNPILSKAAESTIKKWKFRPIKQGDKTIKAIATFSFDYKQ
jgi:protein TonB